MDYRVKTNFLFMTKNISENFSKNINEDYVKIYKNKSLYKKNYKKFFSYTDLIKNELKKTGKIQKDSIIISNNYINLIHYFIIFLGLELSTIFGLQDITNNNLLRIVNGKEKHKELKYSEVLIVNFAYELSINDELLNIIKNRKSNNKETIFIFNNLDDLEVFNDTHKEFYELISKELNIIEIKKSI